MSHSTNVIITATKTKKKKHSSCQETVTDRGILHAGLKANETVYIHT